MPDPNGTESEKEFIARCIPIVLDDGTAQDDKQAYAICKSKWDNQGKAIELNLDLEEIKVGARHSARDQQALQHIHDEIISLGANCPPAPSEIITFPLMTVDKTLVSFGSEVKALGDGKVAGYLVRYGSTQDTDLTGEYFTAETDFGDNSKADVYYQHGADKKLGKRKLTKGDLTTDEVGIWIEAQLSLRDEYEKAIYALAEKGKLGWSSGTAAHLVEKDPDGRIKSWPLGLDATLTPTPAEPRNITVIPLKSYLDAIQITTDQAEAAGDAAPIASDATIIQPEEIINMELTQEQFDALRKDNMEKSAEVAKTIVETALKSLPAIADKAGYVAVTHDEADTPFQTLGAQLEAVKVASLTQGRTLHPRLQAIKQLGANETIGSEGAFLLEPTFVAELLTPLHETGPFSSRAAKIAIGPNSNGVTVRAVDETSRADGSRWGGIRGYRLAEAATKQPSEPAFRLAELRLKKYAVLMYATEELLQDTTALGGIMQQGAAEELDFMINDDICNGVGAGGPQGILKSGALVTVDKEAGQLAATFTTQNVFKMWSRLHPRSKTNSVWFISPEVTPQLYQLSLSVGTGGMPMYMNPGSLPNSPSGALLGRPVVETEFNAALGTVGDIILADMSQYIMIDRDVQAASSIHVQFTTDQVAFRFVYRCDGQTKQAAPLTPYKGSNTISAFVTLATRS